MAEATAVERAGREASGELGFRWSLDGGSEEAMQVPGKRAGLMRGAAGIGAAGRQWFRPSHGKGRVQLPGRGNRWKLPRRRTRGPLGFSQGPSGCCVENGLECS